MKQEGIKTKGVKLKNRRIEVGKDNDDSIVIFATRLATNEDTEPPCEHKHIERNKITTNIRLSNEAAIALFFLLKDVFTNEQLNNFIKEQKWNL